MGRAGGGGVVVAEGVGGGASPRLGGVSPNTARQHEEGGVPLI